MEKLTAVPHAMRVNDPREAARLVQDALAAGDVDGLVSIYADDAVVVPSPGEVATGSTAVRGMLEGWLAEGRLTLKHKTLHQSGEIALEVMEWTMTRSSPTARHRAASRQRSFGGSRTAPGGCKSTTALSWTDPAGAIWECNVPLPR
jgi:ketosteroid isomerase-like protein